MTNENPTRILFLYSDTGGGHRSAVEAIIEAMELEFHGQFVASKVDFFKEYAPPPLNLAPEIYPLVSKSERLWAMSYKMSNGKRQVAIANRMAYPYLFSSVRYLLKDHPTDMIVSVHPLMTKPVRQVIHRRKIPFVTVVTDMVSTHTFWYDPLVDLTILPTESAYERGLELGMSEQKMAVCGLPVAERFVHMGHDKLAARKKLDWPEAQLTLLLVGGGEGMGPLEATAAAIDDSGLPVSLIVVTGRNQRLKQRLEERNWEIPHKIYGFVREMPEFMEAADVLITKAGPGTISEGFIAGLPIILYNRQPGQEEGNVLYVIGEGAGMWAPEPGMVVSVIKNWVKHPDRLAEAQVSSRSLARPEAARQIARLIMQTAQKK